MKVGETIERRFIGSNDNNVIHPMHMHEPWACAPTVMSWSVPRMRAVSTLTRQESQARRWGKAASAKS
jgi:hypothetical protein